MQGDGALYPCIHQSLFAWGESEDDTSPNFLGEMAHSIAIVQRRSQVEASGPHTCRSQEMGVLAGEGD